MQNHIDDSSSTALLVKEAERRGITIVSFPNIDPNTFIFELDGHREPIYFSRTDHNGAVTSRITNNKILTTTLLRRAGFPVPDDLITNNLNEAKAFLEKHKRIVVKPISNTGGTGITTDVTTPSELSTAFELARDLSFTKNESRQAVFQQFVTGDDYRVLVIGQQHIFSTRRIPAHVIGDGTNTVTELTDQWNQQRKPECKIKFDGNARRLLQRQQLTPSSVPQKDQHVRLAGVANYHFGGSLQDATKILSPDTRQLAQKVASYFNTDIIGIDFISPNITETPGYIIELNSTPDLTIHHNPDEGQSRDATGTVLDYLFPETAN